MLSSLKLLLMCTHETKFCPRCKTPFECKVGSILLCQCSTVKLTEEEKDFIGAAYSDCLCASCMTAMRAELHNDKLKIKMSFLTAGYR